MGRGRAIRCKIGNFRLALYCWQVENVYGVNSKVGEDEHFLMWDFDDVPLGDVLWALKRVQREYALPKIYVLSSGKRDHYVAFCFKRCSYRQAAEIIIATPYVDLQFWRCGVIRWRWTIRITPKAGNRDLSLVCTLESSVPEDVKLSEVKSFVKYETPIK